MVKIKNNYGRKIEFEEKIEFIENFLTSCEEWMHGDVGDDCTKARVYLTEIYNQIQNSSKIIEENK